jgi:hypothetical protein
MANSLYMIWSMKARSASTTIRIDEAREEEKSRANCSWMFSTRRSCSLFRCCGLLKS